MRINRTRSKILFLLSGLLLTMFVASPVASATSPAHHSRLSGTTSVTTAPGIAGTLIKAGVLPLPARGTAFSLGYNQGVTARYGFPITGGNPDLATASGDILHSGGINFVSRSAKLQVSDFDIDLAAGKVFATKVNGAKARVALLDLKLSGLKVSTCRGTTTLSGIGLNLDPAGAGALNATFKLNLPTDGSLAFGTATVTLRNGSES